MTAGNEQSLPVVVALGSVDPVLVSDVLDGHCRFVAAPGEADLAVAEGAIVRADARVDQALLRRAPLVSARTMAPAAAASSASPGAVTNRQCPSSTPATSAGSTAPRATTTGSWPAAAGSGTGGSRSVITSARTWRRVPASPDARRRPGPRPPSPR